jgi:Holliday junction resolvase RusA-like endonuclease
MFRSATANYYRTSKANSRFLFYKTKEQKNIDADYIPHTVKPDTDNLLKAVMDAMTEAGVWTDDALVYSTKSEKWYASEGECGARIKVEVRET